MLAQSVIGTVSKNLTIEVVTLVKSMSYNLFMAELDAKPPRKIPAWIARVFIGDAVMFMTYARGASNAKAKEAFGLDLTWPSWRDGFRRGLGG
jgi:hypothetical protein